MKRVFGGLVRFMIYAAVFYLVMGIVPALLMAIMFFGGLLNLIVMRANHGQMPVLVKLEWLAFPPALDSEHCLLTSQSRLRFLADRFRFTKNGKIYSVGDIVLFVASELLTLYLSVIVTLWILITFLKIL